MIEILESRIAPAAVYTYVDAGGDKVTIKTSKGTNAELAAELAMAGSFQGGQLETLNLNSNFTGANITITAQERTPFMGDTFVDIGQIDATGVNLGAVTIHGDLDQIDAGSGVGMAVASLNLQSFGLLGNLTGAGRVEGVFNGALGALNVKAGVVGVNISVTGGIGSIIIGGSLTCDSSGNGGSVQTTNNIGTVKIGGDLVGGADIMSGSIISGGALASVTVGGSIEGGVNTQSGAIASTGNMGPVKVLGDLIGGEGMLSATIFSGGTLASATVGGSLEGGGLFDGSGTVASTGNMGPVTIGQDVIGSVNHSGAILSGVVFTGGDFQTAGAANISSITIGGSLVGGDATDGGGLLQSTGNMGAVKIAGDIRANTYNGTPRALDACIFSMGNLASVTVGGSLTGDAGTGDGSVASNGNMGPVKIGKDVTGGAGDFSGSIISGVEFNGTDYQTDAVGSIASITIGGSLVGSSGNFSGLVQSTGNMGPVKIGGGVHGGFNVLFGPNLSGSIYSMNNLTSVTVGGSLTGGNGSGTGAIVGSGKMGQVTIGGDVYGYAGGQSGFISVGSVFNTNTDQFSETFSTSLLGVNIGGSLIGAGIDQDCGFIQSLGDIGAVKIGGSIIAGQSLYCGGIQCGAALGSLSVKGSLVGNTNYQAYITAEGNPTPAFNAKSDLAIGSIAIGGDVTLSYIEAGYGVEGNTIVVDTHAQLGPVHVGGNWIASNLVAGVENSASNNIDFGNGGDSVFFAGAGGVVSKITSVSIGGLVDGSVSGAGNFGFVAEAIGSFSVGGIAVPIQIGNIHQLGVTGNMDIHELGIM